MNLVNKPKEKKTATGIFKKLSISDLELLSKVNSEKLKESVKLVLSAKIKLKEMRDKYSNL